MRDEGAWWENFAAITIKEGEVERNAPGSQRVFHNRLQDDLCEIERWCREQGVPCRIIGLKGRQTWLTTKSIGKAYHRLRRRRAKACVIGDEYEKSVKNMVAMFDLYAKEDRCPWGSTYDAPSKQFSNGSLLVTETANDPRAGASGTFQVVVATEVAFWPDTGVRSSQKVLAALLNCVPKKADTLVILESTANGMQGAYYDTYQGAVTFDEFKAGKRGNGFIKVFFPWFEHEEYRTLCMEGEAAEIMGSLTDREQSLVEKSHVCVEALKWRREKIAGPEFNGDEDFFDQEYPPDEHSCFLASGRMAFTVEGLERVEADGAMLRRDVLAGCVDRAGGGVVFRATGEVESWCKIYKLPEEGRRYGVIVDPATGVERAKGEDPDRHSVLVVEAGDVVGDRWCPPAVVARVRPPCYVALNLLADWVDRLSWFYGRCIVTLEINNSGLALYEAARPFTLPFYKRKVPNFRGGTETEMVGWDTSEATRRFLVETLQRAIRLHGQWGEGVSVSCEHAMLELRKFVLNAKGRAEAARGYHDDDVMALGMGLATQGAFTRFSRVAVPRAVPPDLLALEAAMARASGVGSAQWS